MDEKPEALRLADVPICERSIAWQSDATIKLRRLHAVNQELLEALQLAVLQNEHDMLMTGEELRICRAAIAKAEGK